MKKLYTYSNVLLYFSLSLIFFFLSNCAGTTGSSALPQAIIETADNDSGTIAISTPDASTGYVVVTGTEDSIPSSSTIIVELGTASTASLLLDKVQNYIFPKALAEEPSCKIGDENLSDIPQCPELSATNKCKYTPNSDGSFTLQVPATTTQSVSISYVNTDCEGVKVVNEQDVPQNVTALQLEIRDWTSFDATQTVYFLGNHIDATDSDGSPTENTISLIEASRSSGSDGTLYTADKTNNLSFSSVDSSSVIHNANSITAYTSVDNTKYFILETTLITQFRKLAAPTSGSDITQSAVNMIYRDCDSDSSCSSPYMGTSHFSQIDSETCTDNDLIFFIKNSPGNLTNQSSVFLLNDFDDATYDSASISTIKLDLDLSSSDLSGIEVSKILVGYYYNQTYYFVIKGSDGMNYVIQSYIIDDLCTVTGNVSLSVDYYQELPSISDVYKYKSFIAYSSNSHAESLFFAILDPSNQVVQLIDTHQIYDSTLNAYLTISLTDYIPSSSTDNISYSPLSMNVNASTTAADIEIQILLSYGGGLIEIAKNPTVCSGYTDNVCETSEYDSSDYQFSAPTIFDIDTFDADGIYQDFIIIDKGRSYDNNSLVYLKESNEEV